MTELIRSTPSAENTNARAIGRFIDAVSANDKLELHGIAILKNGKLIAEGAFTPYNLERPTMLFSLSKTFAATAIGFLVQEKKLQLTDKLIDLLSDDAPDQPGVLWHEVTVHHLLSMNTGQVIEPEIFSDEPGATARFFDQPIIHTPGTHFLYNTAATYMLSAIVQKITGDRLRDYLMPRLFAPLGIDEPFWQQIDGIDAGGFGLMLKPLDIAKFGQFCLNRGTWNGERLLDSNWFDKAFRVYSDNGATGGKADWGAGYGYQCWRCEPGCWRGDGAFGQYCVILPEQNAVVAITAGLSDMQAVLTILWRELLPGLSAKGNEAADTALALQLQGLGYQAPKGRPQPEPEKDLNGKTLQLNEGADIESLTFNFDHAGLIADCKIKGKMHQFHLGRERWVHTKFPDADRFFGTGEVADPASGAFHWADSRTLVLTLRTLNTPFVVSLRIVVEDGKFAMAQQLNVAFGNDDQCFEGVLL